MSASKSGAMTGRGLLAVTGEPALVRALSQITLLDNFAAAEAPWRALEARAVLTPYQRFDWMAALYHSGVERGRLVIACIGPLERPLALLPLAVGNRGGLRQAQLIGSDYANSDWMMVDPAAARHVTRPVLMALFDSVVRQAGGIDVIRFTNLPAQWRGVKNPLLALRHQKAPNNLYASRIGDVALPFIDHGLSGKLRSNLRRGRARLEEQFGPVTTRRVCDGAELAQVHAAFLAQRGERFARMGVDNIFARPEMVALFLSLCEAGFGQAQPAFVAHALYAGDEIVATTFGAVADGHYSQYINSTSAGPASRYSLMGILMGDLMDDLIGAGLTGFDMGTGDFAYKADWTQPQTVFDSAIAVSQRGVLVLPVLEAVVRVKRAIKQNPRAWALAQRVIKARYRVRDMLGR